MTAARPAPASFRILICDELAPQAMEVFKSKGFEPEVAIGMKEDELVARVKGVHALVVRSATKVTRRVIEAADVLRVVGRAGVGVDNVDCDAASERGVVVMNTPTGNTTTTAELALALMFALARHVTKADRETKKGGWGKKGMMGTEITGKTLGVIGLGRIGRVVADRALGLKMKVLAHDPFVNAAFAAGLPAGASPMAGVELADLDTLLARSDFVTLHVPLLDGTRNLLSKERIAKMKKGARLINCARGGLVDEAAALDAVEKKHLAGLAFDVLAEEPPAKEHPLLGKDDVIVTPHLGASSNEAQLNVAIDVARQISEFLLEGVANNAVNVPAVGSQDLREVGPYVVLSEKLGAFLAQVAGASIQKLELTVSGEIAKKDWRHVPLALLSSVLRQNHDEGVNFVNAPLFAKERGLQLFERAEPEHGVYPSSITVRATDARGGAHTVEGTLFGRSPRITRFDELELDLEPKGCVLVTRHADEPGVVGALGTLLARHQVNIRRVELGPASAGLAMGLLSLYGEPSQAVLDDVRKLPAVREARLLKL
ncbi:MAG: phosphoglycerate dehydrogenase [Planctomycetes bacterium]|nr:phosphoglycerate dehydrogenase [Planctomycetota bacterium]